MPSKNPIHIGDYVIINESDAPQTKLIARVTEVSLEQNRVTAEYICKATNTVKCAGRLSEATLVSDFGVELKFEDDTVYAYQDRPSVAFYLSDRALREWQPGSLNPTQRLRRCARAAANATCGITSEGNADD